MALTKIDVTGTAQVQIIDLICVCAFCNNHNSEAGTVELNFGDQSLHYVCNKCKKQNTIQLSPKQSAPLPKTRLGR